MSRDDDLHAIDLELVRLGRIMASSRGHRLRSDRSRTDLAPHELSVLAELARHGPSRLGLLAGRVQMELPHASRTVRALADRGLVTHAADPRDGRAVRVDVTRRGRTEVERYRAASRALLAEGLVDWSNEQLHQLGELLAELVDAFVRHPELAPPEPVKD